MNRSHFEQTVRHLGRFVLLAVGSLLAEGEGRVHGHAVQPSGKLRVAAEGVDLADDLKEHVLSDILGVGVVTEHAPSDVVDPRRVLAEH